MRRFAQTLATAVVIVVLATATLTAKPLGGDDPRPIGPGQKIVRIIKHLISSWLDDPDISVPKP